MATATQTSSEFSEKEIRNIPLDQIEPDKDQPRKEFKEGELVESIKINGQIQPIHVTTGKDGKYKIVDGERRWRAHKALVEQVKGDTKSEGKDFSKIRAIYVKKDNQVIGIIGNIARNSYNPMETADAIMRLKKLLGKDGKEAIDDNVAKYIGKSRTLIVDYRSLSKLPTEIQEKARKDGRVPFNKMRDLANKEGTNEEKIKEYDNLYKIYSSKESDKTSSNIPKADKDTQRISLIHDKINAVNKALAMKAFTKIKFDKVDDSVKEDLKKSLQATRESVDALIQKLSPSQPDND